MANISKQQAEYRHEVRAVTVLQPSLHCELFNDISLIENQVRVCKECEYYLDKACQLVNKDSDGDDRGIIHPNAVCKYYSEKCKKNDIEYWVQYLI